MLNIMFNRYLKWGALGLIGCIGLLSCGASNNKNDRLAQQKKTNILFIISDDQGYPYASAYGCKFVNTPNFDSIAAQGILFNNFFVDAPQCSPSRASLLTGKHIWQIGPAGTHASIFPAGLTTYTDVLSAHDYEVGYCGKGWGPGSWQDGGRSYNPAGRRYFDKSDMYTKSYPEKRWATGISKDNYAADFNLFLAKRNKDKPFCFWFGGNEPHRGYQPGSGLKRGGKLSSVTVPGYLPDVNEVRSDFLDYALEIQWFDAQVGKALTALKKAGELDNTLIMFIGDNGMPFPRAKALCLEAGVHTPFAMMWKNHIKNPGRVVNDLVSAVDFFPTFLDAAGVKDTATNIQGKSLLNIFQNGKSGVTDPSRKYVFFGRERHSDARWENLGYPERAVRTDQYLYIWNLKPERYPAGAPKQMVGDSLIWAYSDIDGSPTKNYMIQHQNDLGRSYNPEESADNGQLTPHTINSASIFQGAFGKYPKEMLYNIKKDPDCLKNLAEEPTYQKVKENLASVLIEKLKKTHDSRLGTTPDIWESYRRYGVMRKFPEPGWAKKKLNGSTITK